MSEINYDDLLFPILHREGSIISFFDVIFDFLNRRTDYFKIKNEKNPAVGFEKGEAEKIIRSVFCKYMEQAMTKYKLELSESSHAPLLDDFVAEEVVETTEVSNNDDASSPDKESKIKESIDVSAKKDNCEQQSEVKVPWTDPDCYNGAQFDDYSWAQTIADIDVRIKVPKSITNGKQVRVKIQQGQINVEACSDGEWNVLKKGDLLWKINVEESTWTLVPGEHIHICLQKIQERWWDSLFVGEPKIDMKSIDPSISYEDLDEESQAKISELMYNEHQKKLGNPTIQQMKIQTKLKEAWNIEGSPFKGLPFDPSVIDIQNADSLS